MIAYCGGTFDCLHYGHIKLLKWAKQQFDYVVVGLNSDHFVEKYKKVAPLYSFEKRMESLAELRCVDEVIENIGDENSQFSIRLIKPTHIVNGSDWTRERLMRQMSLTEEFLEEIKAEIVIFPDSDPLHTSDIKKRISQ